MMFNRTFRFNKPPLIEAVFEAFVAGSTDNEMCEKATQQLLTDYQERLGGEVKNLLDSQLQFGVGAGGISAPQFQQGTRVQVWSADKQRVVQFSPVMASINLLGLCYESYAAHRSEIDEFLTRYRSYFQPSKVLHIGQRFINRVQIPEGVRPEDVFQIYPHLSRSLTHVHPPFSLQLQSEVLGTQGGVTLSVVYQGILEQQNCYILDIYARSGPDVGDWVLWHDAAHDAVRRAFRLAFTDAGLASFGEEHT